ncbi:hypothetical protein BC830DRAFT_1120258 [Chytriomyces sp. MP71]|nr:hypothetical protein BC830DRAFT_1120258 [Chytriomyces sp. MP71]
MIRRSRHAWATGDGLSSHAVWQRLKRDADAKLLPFHPRAVPVTTTGGAPGRVLPVSATHGYLPNDVSLSAQDSARYADHLVRGPVLFNDRAIADGRMAFGETLEGTPALLTLVSLGGGIQGHEGVSHGGFLSALVDSCFGTLFMLASKGMHSGVTARLELDYRRAMPVPSNVACVVWVDQSDARSRKVWLRGDILSLPSSSSGVASLKDLDPSRSDLSLGRQWLGKDATLFAESRALFLKLDKQQLSKVKSGASTSETVG